MLAIGRRLSVVEFDGQAFMPSAVFLRDDGTLTVGREAERLARLAPERFEPNPKRRIDDVDLLLGTDVLSVRSAIAAVLRRVLQAATAELDGGRPASINLTHPAQWGSRRRRLLLESARDAGLGQPTLIPEPIAAATHFGSLPGRSPLAAGCSLAVYDLGGGTFDCALIESIGTGYLVLSEGGLAEVGGVDFDQALLEHIGRTTAHVDPHHWQAMAVPQTATDRRAARSLREDVRAAKELLSRYQQTDLPLPEPFPDALLTRGEMESLIRPAVVRTVTQLQRTVRSSQRLAEQLAGIYLVGGSSRIPLVAGVIADRMGIMPVTIEDPELAVAFGAAMATGVQTNKDGNAVTRAGVAPNHTASQRLTDAVPAPVVIGAVQEDPAVRRRLCPEYRGRTPGQLGWLLASAAIVVTAAIAGMIMLTGRGIGLTGAAVAVPPTGTTIASSASVNRTPRHCPPRPAGRIEPSDCLKLLSQKASASFHPFGDVTGTGNFRAMIASSAPVDVVSLTGRDAETQQLLLLVFVQLKDGSGRDEMLRRWAQDLGAPPRAAAGGRWPGRILQGRSVVNQGQPAIVYAVDAMPVVVLLTPAIGDDVAATGHIGIERLRAVFTTQVLL